MAAAVHRRYSCESAPETLEWMNAIAEFLRPFRSLLDAHVVNFFKDRLWEMVDKQWMECLRGEPVENLLGIPSGLVQDYWPASLQEFILTLRSLAFPREPKLSHSILTNLHMEPLGSVLSQGMNSKKKHEVKILAAVVKTVANYANAQTVIDVGAGQGYLAQALSFQYHLSVIAIDACLHHANVTSARAERIKKHYAAKLHNSPHENLQLRAPETVTCHVLSSDTLTTLSTASSTKENVVKLNNIEHKVEIDFHGSSKADIKKAGPSSDTYGTGSSLVLAGLHACGDLSVNMLRTFADCQQVKALVGIGCCYNLLSEECLEKTNIPQGFPLSSGAKLAGLILGKNARDLACQSAERWRSLTKDAALQNFDIHAFRAAFQMVLDKYYPLLLASSPSIGRQGKALRRQLFRRVLESRFGAEGSILPFGNSKEDSVTMKSGEVELVDRHYSYIDDACKTSEVISQSKVCFDVGCEEIKSHKGSDKYMLFKEFSKSGLCHLGMEDSQDINFLEIWKKAEPFSELVGPYWSLRAALGQLVETYILLDRLLFLQEQGNPVEASLVSLFDPTLSPRNVAIIAWKNHSGIESQRFPECSNHSRPHNHVL